MVDVGFGNPDVVGGQVGAFGGFQEIEIGMDDTVGEDVLLVLAQEDGTRVRLVGEQRFVKTLPDVASGATVDGRVALAADVCIYKVALFDFQCL